MIIDIVSSESRLGVEILAHSQTYAHYKDVCLPFEFNIPKNNKK